MKQIAINHDRLMLARSPGEKKVTGRQWFDIEKEN
jgi:hypothetical protein